MFNIKYLLLWSKRAFTMPAPKQVKWEVLTRYGGDGLWVETGTYQGETAQFLADNCRQVISIEPSEFYFNYAQKNLKHINNIKLINGTSEEILDQLLRTTRLTDYDTLSFWLDGHFSGGFTYFSGNNTPIQHELNVIKKYLGHEKYKIQILIDDVRSFTRPGFISEGYPSLKSLVLFCEKNSLWWTIEHDIFIMKE